MVDLDPVFNQKDISDENGPIDTKVSGTDSKVEERVHDLDANIKLTAIAAALGASSGNIFKKNELNITSKNEVDLSGTTYVVPSGKTFLITSFAASYDAQALMYVRLKKQTGGSGPFETQFRLVMMNGGQGDSTNSFNFGGGIAIGQPGDVFKITVEASLSKGTVWAEFSGNEV